jgi:hypothetical protein
MDNSFPKTAKALSDYSGLDFSELLSAALSFDDKFRLGAVIFSPSQTWPHQHSPASLMMQTPDPQQRLSGAFILKTFFPISANKKFTWEHYDY